MAEQPWRAALEKLLAVPVLQDAALTEEEIDFPEEVFDAVEEMITANGSDDIAPIIAAAVAAGRIPPVRAADVLDIASWSGTDNGAAMQRTLDDWLRQADDPVRVYLALHTEVYPLPTAAEMRAVLTVVAARHPEYRAVCERMIASRRGG
ncbi:hypothetical protein [Kitasatospora sp. LaBMicrA B282]|uniref:hypothetical protein n=1 Tax=Kitasatospora sp. LaBMicrA B282 TaxID=3420949 RepID=UPI003D1478D9